MTSASLDQNPASPLIVVVGATSKTGRRVADRLRERGSQVRAVSRRTRIGFDWTDRSSWPAALAGAGAAYVTYQPDLIAPGSGADIAAFVDTAVDAGVRRLVLLSGRGEAEAEQAERIIHGSPLETTALSCAWFAQNFTEGAFAAEITELGTLTMPVGEVGEPFIDVEDIVDVATTVLIEGANAPNPHAGKTYALTGPRLLSFAQAAAEIGDARGMPVAFQRVSAGEYRDIVRSLGVPDADAAIVHELFATLFDGRNAHVSDDVERILGRPAADFATVLRRVLPEVQQP